MSGLDLTDTHAHLDFEQFDDDREEALTRARQAGVGRLVNVGTDLVRSERAVRFAEVHDNVWATVGIHPHDAAAVDEEAIDRLKRLAAHKQVVAIGEFGFDFHYDDGPDEETQRDAFRAQSDIAIEAGLPVIVHSRDAEPLTLEHLTDHADEAVADNPARREPGVVHCFTGSLEFAESALGLGYLISFTAPVTYPRNEALRAVVKAVPLEKLMVETDCPFLPPADKRGQRNEPAYVVETAKKVAEIKEISLEAVARATTDNAKRLFGLD
jgi:TatD DNase family protein